MNAELVRELFTLNPSTGVLIWTSKTPEKRVIGKRAGSLSTSGYRTVMIREKRCQEHRVIWLHHYGKHPNGVIDHINGITWDNRIVNLRDVSHAQNIHNMRGPNKGNSHGTLGITFNKSRKKWYASIMLNKKRIHIGSFDDPKSASDAYIAAKRKLHPTSTL